jgi:hypothetical protein
MIKTPLVRHDTARSHRPLRAGLPSGYHRGVEKNRLEAFSDGVLAIIITIMVLEMKVQRPIIL